MTKEADGDGTEEKPSGAAAPANDDGDMNVDRQTYVDRDNLDFDPDDGLLSGTAIDGTSDIPGPHENQDDTTPDVENSPSPDGEGTDDSPDAADSPDHGREDETEKAAGGA